MKFGLKLGSNAIAYFNAAQALRDKGCFDYIELFIVPGSDVSLAQKWKSLNVPFIFHAPHSLAGMNLSLKENETHNRKCISEVAVWARALQPRWIIYHAGLNGTLNETIRQFAIFKQAMPDAFRNALIENKPKVGINGECCLGVEPAELSSIMTSLGFGFCLDFGHALCAAYSLNENEKTFLDKLFALNPKVHHLSDGKKHTQVDSHAHLGKGELDLPWLLSLVPAGGWLTLETNKNYPDKLDDFAEDIRYAQEAA
ncbi:MAG: TIM barrel protein [Fibrobacterota bacterium]